MNGCGREWIGLLRRVDFGKWMVRVDGWSGVDERLWTP